MLLALLVNLLTAVLLAGPEEYEGKRIAEIQFNPPDQPLTADYLARLVEFKAGDTLHLRDVSAAIERLYATGRYSNITVDAETRDGEVVLRFNTSRTWFIGRVAVDGVPEPPNEGQLAHATKLDLGGDYNEKQLQQAVKNVGDMLRGNGLFQSRISPRFDTEPRIEQINFRFDVDAGPRAVLARPVITGDPQRPILSLVNATRWRRLRGLFGWRPATDARVQNGLERVRNLYEKSDHLMARVSLEKMDYNPQTNRATPTVAIDAGPRVSVRTSGAKVSQGRLRQLLPIYQEHSVDGSLLVEGRRNLTEYFQAQGYFEAAVDFTTDQQGQGQQIIDYQVDRGERHKLVFVGLSGNKYFDDATIRERLYVHRATFLRFRHGRFSQKLLDRDRDAILDLYRANGFRDAEVDTRAVDDYQGRIGNVGVFIDIREGTQYRVAALDISGVDLKLLPEVEGLLQSTAGQPFSDLNIISDRDTVLGYYFNNGYPEAGFDWSSQPADKPFFVNLKYVVREGPRRYVRDVIIGGLEKTNRDLVTSRISLRPGDPLSQSRMVESQRNLYDLGIFARVDTAVQNPEGRERDKYVLYQFEEAKKYSLSAGFGAEIAKIGGGAATSLDAPAGTAGFSPRVLFGISRLNFLGVGHSLSLNTRASTIQKRGVLTYLAPQVLGTDNLSLSFTGLYDNSKDVRTFSAKRFEGSAQLGQRLSKASTIQYRLTYRRVSVDQGTLKITPELIPLFSQPVRIGLVSSTFVQDRRDDPTDSHRGIYNSLDFGAATNLLGSQTDFFRTLGRNSTYHRLRRDWIFARTLTVGWIHNLRASREIPLPERFFAGGAASHRGFPDNQAGPRDPQTGFPIGGKALLINSFELRFPLVGENIGGVFFHDAGNVYSNLKDISFRYKQRKDLPDFDYMEHAVGFGIRYRTPIGPIRLDLAFAPNSPRFFGFKGTREELLFGGGQQVVQRISRFQFHFSLGQAF